HREMDLGGDDDAVAAAARQRPAHDLLGLTAGVRVGGVDEVDAGVEGPVDDPGRLLMVGVPPGAEHHGAETQGAHLDAGAAEGADLHGRLLLAGGIPPTVTTRLERPDTDSRALQNGRGQAAAKVPPSRERDGRPSGPTGTS